MHESVSCGTMWSDAREKDSPAGRERPVVRHGVGCGGGGIDGTTFREGDRMNGYPFFSVLMPVYNGAEFLADALASLRA